MVSNRPPVRGRRPPPRPKTPANYIPTAVGTVAHSDTINHLLNEEQKSGCVRMHPIPAGRLASSSRPSPATPTTLDSVKDSSKSKRSALDIARRSLTSGLDRSRATIGKTGPAVKTAVAASKRVAIGAAGRLNKIATNALKANEKGKGKEKEEMHPLSRSSSSSSNKSLFYRRRLPKLQIPDVDVAVREALNSACSTDTQDSPNFRLLEISPTSRDLKYEMLDDDHPPDVMAEYHNMLSARRRVRKCKFGAEVMRYCEARPTWRDHWACRAPNDNMEDRELLKGLTDALQHQKDVATRLVQRVPHLFPGLQPVSSPGCTLKMYWQHKSVFS
ncbi:hypothetical protein F5Y12DRAFT_707014 [Xylaria sp. FL1777]|nr:hypothetical protein F5Y12DRAFT_707014 [Xylaria sp. FL1777]